MIWVILLLFIGVALFFIELFFIPGTTVVGFIGISLAALGIYFAYSQFGVSAGHISLLITLALIVALIIYGAKSNAWSKLANKDAITSKSNVIDNEAIKPGDKGVAVSDIKPIGKARISDKNYEVRSMGEFIHHGNAVEVIKVTGNKIFVKKISSDEFHA